MYIGYIKARMTPSGPCEHVLLDYAQNTASDMATGNM